MISNAIIVGAGIGGLTLAIALRQRGITPTVYEAAPLAQPAGSGITVPPNALGVLERLGIAQTVCERGMPIARAEIYDIGGGRLQTLDTAVQTGAGTFELVAIHRSMLHATLVEALPAGVIQTGKTLVRVETTPEDVTAYFADGTSAQGDVLIAADGLRSVVRNQFWPGAALRFSGQGSFRGIAALALPDNLRTVAREIWAPGARFGFVAVSPSTTYWYATLDATPGELRSLPIRGTLNRAFGAFPQPVQDVLNATALDQVVCTDIYDLRGLDHWHTSRIVLLGDAAHAMTPNLGQGGAQAIEDAAVLADALACNAQPGDAFIQYQKLRQARTRAIVDQSWQIGRAAHLANPILRTLRNAAMRHVPAQFARRQADFLYRQID